VLRKIGRRKFTYRAIGTFGANVQDSTRDDDDDDVVPLKRRRLLKR
jgi:hypothetical protein